MFPLYYIGHIDYIKYALKARSATCFEGTANYIRVNVSYIVFCVRKWALNAMGMGGGLIIIIIIINLYSTGSITVNVHRRCDDCTTTFCSI